MLTQNIPKKHTKIKTKKLRPFESLLVLIVDDDMMNQQVLNKYLLAN